MAKSIIWQQDGVRIVGDVEALRALKVPIKDALEASWPILEYSLPDALGKPAWLERGSTGSVERTILFELVKRCLEM